MTNGFVDTIKQLDLCIRNPLPPNIAMMKVLLLLTILCGAYAQTDWVPKPAWFTLSHACDVLGISDCDPCTNNNNALKTRIKNRIKIRSTATDGILDALSTADLKEAAFVIAFLQSDLMGTQKTISELQAMTLGDEKTALSTAMTVVDGAADTTGNPKPYVKEAYRVQADKRASL